MAENNNEGYALKKSIIRKWIYEYGYTQKMIACALHITKQEFKKKTFDFVLVYQLDRFARNRYDSANYKAKLKKNGVRVLSAKESITDDASGILVEGMLET